MEASNTTKPQKAYKGKKAQIPIIDSDNPNAKAIAFLKRCLKSEFIVHSVESRVATRSPAPPFTTSTLQQEANRKFGMQIETTMKTAQKLYEGGYITYMRTDSVEISEEGQTDIKKVIEDQYGADYYQKNVYKNKSSSSQEAHEAIRPTHPEMLSVEKEIDDEFQIKLYKLIWERTIASQMKAAKINVTTIQINITKYVENELDPFYYFQSQIEKVIFPGFMKVYVESTDDNDSDDPVSDNDSPIPEIGDILKMHEIKAQQQFPKAPSRYTQASMVKKLEELGIGRPSTFVNTIKTIIDRTYVKIADVPGTKKKISIYSISTDEDGERIMKVFEQNEKITLGSEKKKIIPTDLGITVCDYLIKNFPEMMDYHFTAKMETELDAIANGDKTWYKVVDKFYSKLKPTVDELMSKKSISQQNEKSLGTDPDGNEILATLTKYGPAVKKIIGEKIVYSKIKPPLTLDDITLEEAIKLFEYPKTLGEYKDGDILLQKGQYGFYLVYKGQNYSIPPDITDVNLDVAIKIIETRTSNVIAEFDLVDKSGKKVKAIILKGQYGPYIQAIRSNGKTNYPIPRNIDPTKLAPDQIIEMISHKKSYKKPKSDSKPTDSNDKSTESASKTRKSRDSKPRKTTARKTTARKTTARKTTARKTTARKTAKP